MDFSEQDLLGERIENLAATSKEVACLKRRKVSASTSSVHLCSLGPSTAAANSPPEVADFQRSVILNQVENGIAVRMAVLEKVIG